MPSPIMRYVGEPLDIVVTFTSDPLVPYGHTYSDIDEISMCWKKDVASDADDAYLQKLETTSGVVLSEITHSFTMTIGSADYASVLPGNYILVLAAQVNSPAEFIELDIPWPEILVTTDQHRS